MATIKHSTTKSGVSGTNRLLLFLLKKIARITFRWSIYLLLGIITWLLFDPLPASFAWFVVASMLGSMSIHTILHRKGVTAGVAKQASRYVFFLSFPMLFVFAGNRVAVWGASEAPVSMSQMPSTQLVRQGVVPSEEYLLFKKIQKEHFKGPKKSKKGLRKTFRKYLLEFKEMDKATRTILIIFGVILLLIILFLMLIVYSVAETADSCAGGSNSSNDTSCCME